MYCRYMWDMISYILSFVLLSFSSFPPFRIRTLAPKHTSPCARTLVCWSLFSPSCCWRVSQSWVLQRTCATCGRRFRRNRVRQRPRSISSNKSLSVSSWAGPCKRIGGSIWWQASSRLLVIWNFKSCCFRIEGGEMFSCLYVTWIFGLCFHCLLLCIIIIFMYCVTAYTACTV